MHTFMQIEHFIFKFLIPIKNSEAKLPTTMYHIFSSLISTLFYRFYAILYAIDRVIEVFLREVFGFSKKKIEFSIIYDKRFLNCPFGFNFNI